MAIFISYILLGISLSAPVGPINAAQLDKGIKDGFLSSWILGLGAMVADGLFMVLIFFGLHQFLDVPFIKMFLWIFGLFVLCYTGVECILTSSKKSLVSILQTNRENRWKVFSKGFFMALSNPLNVLFWLGIYGSILVETSKSYSSYQVFLYSLGIFIGIMLWDFIMAGLASSARRWLNEKVQRIISIFAGVSLVCFGLYFGFEAYIYIMD